MPRDDFSETIKRNLAARVGNRCSHCDALTSGPQSDPDKALNVGVAAHITAAAPGGPRYDSSMTPQARSGINNAIWLCQNCAKLVDNDAARYTVAYLKKWKHDAEKKALTNIGRAQQARPSSVTARERQIKHDLKMKHRMERDFLRPLNRRATWPWEKFAHTEVVIHSIEDTTYPGLDETEGISSWFKVEVWDFYYNGLEVIGWTEQGILDDEGRWMFPAPESYDEQKFQEVTIVKTGRIPWRNIVEYHIRGDEYYHCPHLYCKYADNGQPYEDFAYYLMLEERYWPLEKELRMEISNGEM